LFFIYVYFEEDHNLVPDGTVENAIENRKYHLTFFYDNGVSEYDMTTNPENFIVYDNVKKIRLDVEDDNYWRTRIPQTVENINIYVVDNIIPLQQYEFTLMDMTGEFGIYDNGQVWFNRYSGDNLMNIHEDYWDVEESVTVFLIYGKEYNVRLVTPEWERAHPYMVVDGILTKVITVGQFETGDPDPIWDSVAWSAWWTDDNYLRVTYEDNTGNTDNVVLTIYDENDEVAYTTTLTTNEWIVTWTSANENLTYIVAIEINHGTYGFLDTESIILLMGAWTPPIPEALPGVSQLGSLPFAWGTAIAVFFSLVVGLTFGARHAGFTVFVMGLVLVVMGPIMGIFEIPAAIVAFIVVVGVMLMLVKRRS